MKATAQRNDGTFRHTVRVRDHRLIVDEPPVIGGEDAGPEPQELLAASLASCTAITMEMYASRKGWEIGDVEVDVRVHPGRAGLSDASSTRSAPARGPARGAGGAPAGDRREVPGAPHARRGGHVSGTSRARHRRPAARPRGAARAGTPDPIAGGGARAAVPDGRRGAPRGFHQAPRGPAPPRRARSLSRGAAATRRTPTCATRRCARPRRRSACRASEVSVLGALDPTATFVTDYLIHPFVGLIPAGQVWSVSPVEVDAVLELPLRALREGRTRTTSRRVAASPSRPTPTSWTST